MSDFEINIDLTEIILEAFCEYQKQNGSPLDDDEKERSREQIKDSFSQKDDK